MANARQKQKEMKDTLKENTPEIDIMDESVVSDEASHTDEQGTFIIQPMLYQPLLQLKEIQETTLVTKRPANSDKVALYALNRLPGVIDLIIKSDNVVGVVDNLCELTDKVTPAMVEVAKGLHGVTLAMDLISVVRIPMIYVAALFAREKPPMTLSNNAKWIYSAIILTLAIVALAVPVTAPFIGITAAAAALSVGVFTLGRLLVLRYRHTKTVNDLDEKIADATLLVETLKAESTGLIDVLQKTIDVGESVSDNAETKEEHIARFISTIEEKTRLFKEEHDKLQGLYDEKIVHEAALKEHNLTKAMDKGVAITLGFITLLAAILALFFPPVATGLLAFTGVSGFLYGFTRVVAMPLYGKIRQWLGKTTAPEVKLTVVDKTSDTTIMSFLSNQPAESINQTLEGDVVDKVDEASENPLPVGPAIVVPVKEENEGESEAEGTGIPFSKSGN